MNGKLAYNRQGSGYPLVLVHGYLAGAAIWDYQLDHFKDKFDVVVPNLPGFGQSASVQAPKTIDGFAALLLDDLSLIGIEKFHLLGHSMGGMIVQTMAAQAPERVNHLVCYGTGPQGVLPGRFETIDESRQRLEEQGVSQVVQHIAATWFFEGIDAPGYAECVSLGKLTSQQAALACLDAWQAWDGRRQLSEIRSQTLVVWGEHDRSYAWEQTEALWRGISHCSLAVIPGCAHNVHMEKPQLFNMIVGDFLPESL